MSCLHCIHTAISQINKHDLPKSDTSLCPLLFNMRTEETQKLQTHNVNKCESLEPAEVRLLKYYMNDVALQGKIDVVSGDIAHITKCQPCDSHTSADKENQHLKTGADVSARHAVVLNYRTSSPVPSPWIADGVLNRSNLMKGSR